MGPETQGLSTGVPLRPCLPTQASPPRLCPRGRTRDLTALLTVMAAARRFIHVSVMEYFPTTRFSRPARCASAAWGVGAALRMGTGPGRRGPSRAKDLNFPSPRYWPVLDNALRAAAFSRGVQVRLLVGCGLNTDPSMFPYLRSLQAFSDPKAGVSVDVVRTRFLGWRGLAALLPS